MTTFDDWPNSVFIAFTESKGKGKTPNELVLTYVLDSGDLHFAWNERELFMLDPDEWLRLLSFLHSNRGLHEWMENRKDEIATERFKAKLDILAKTGLQGLELCKAALPSSDDRYFKEPDQ